MRDGFAAGQHAEAGADLIDAGQRAVLDLSRRLGLRTIPILRRGFGFFTVTPRGRVVQRSLARSFREVESSLRTLVREYELAEQRWDSAIARALARRSVADWMDELALSPRARERVRGLRGLFLADPEHLSLLAFVDFFRDLGESGWESMSRIRGGNDRIATALARRIRGPIHLKTILRRIRQDDRSVRATVDGPSGETEITADLLVCTLPASTLRDVMWDPSPPVPQRDAIARLQYGPATRLLLQFHRPFWRRRDRPSAFGSDQPIGAVWDGSEGQRGGPAILSFLAGGGASRDLCALLENEGVEGVTRRVRWLGRPTRLLAARRVTWEDDPWSRGGYAVFDPSFDPDWRAWLARPFGRVLFAGEHTSSRWQGYMNGAIESGLRAAAEAAAIGA
jgi:monoamine oxidase